MVPGRSWIRSPVSRSGNRHESCLPLARPALLIKETIHSQGNPDILLRYVLASILLYCSLFLVIRSLLRAIEFYSFIIYKIVFVITSTILIEILDHFKTR